MHSIGAALFAYIVAATLLTVTPGLDTALVLRTAATEGARRAWWAGLGIVSGCLVWAMIVAAGLGMLLLASRLAYTALRWLGAAYLLYVGWKLLRHPRAQFMPQPVPGQQPVPVRLGAHAFTRGLLTNLFNPKVGIFYVSFLPQFIPAQVSVGPYTVLLGIIHAALGLLWFGCLIAATRPLARWMRRPRVLRALDRITGAVFVAFGVRLAVSRAG